MILTYVADKIWSMTLRRAVKLSFFALWKSSHFLIIEEIVFQRSIDCKKNVYICGVSEEKYANARKHFVLSPYLKFAKISMRDRRNQCSFCVYAGYVRSVRRPRIYHGVGILFLHCSSHWGVWRCLRYVDVRRQVSRLSCFYTLY